MGNQQDGGGIHGGGVRPSSSPTLLVVVIVAFAAVCSLIFCFHLRDVAPLSFSSLTTFDFEVTTSSSFSLPSSRARGGDRRHRDSRRIAAHHPSVFASGDIVSVDENHSSVGTTAVGWLVGDSGRDNDPGDPSRPRTDRRRHRRLRAMPVDGSAARPNRGGKNNMFRYDTVSNSHNGNNGNNNNNDKTMFDDDALTQQAHHRYRRPPSSGTQPSTPLEQLLRRAKDVVSESDVPLLLQIPHTSSETLYRIMTECYGLVGRRYDSLPALDEARRRSVVDSYYVGGHDRPASMFKNFGERFHFLATPHYREGAALLTLRHKGRVILTLRHPCEIAEREYLASDAVVAGGARGVVGGGGGGDVAGLVRHVNSTDYIDNRMTRMLADVPSRMAVTEDHYRAARMVIENKFLIGMTSDMSETVRKRLALYFGWREMEGREGCEMEQIKRGTMNELSPGMLVEGSYEWRFVRKRNHYDMKLYARGMAVFGDQKMRVPVHSLVRKREKAIVDEAFGHLRNVKDQRDSSDIPFFWHIPKASGTTVKETLSDCYGLVRTEMIRPPSSLEVIEDKHVLNVDLTTPDAVAVAKRKRVADRGLADVFVSQLSLEGSTVFTTYHMGRAFTIMRHPVKLAASLFYYRRIATWEPTYRPEYKDITLQEYVSKDGYYDNWMVRMLTNSKLGGLNESHLELAKMILKEKFVIGISDHMDETFRHLELYYGWAERKEGCVNFHLHSAPSNKNKYPVPERGGPEWTIIADKNKYDMALYYYALELFGDQSEKMFRAEKAVD